MGNPTLAEQVEAVLASRDKVNTAFERLSAITPDLLKGPEEVLRAALVSAVEGLDVPSVVDSLRAAAAVIQEGKGIVGGGFDASLA